MDRDELLKTMGLTEETRLAAEVLQRDHVELAHRQANERRSNPELACAGLVWAALSYSFAVHGREKSVVLFAAMAAAAMEPEIPKPN